MPKGRQTIGKRTSTGSRSGETPTANVARQANRHGNTKAIDVRAEAHFI